MERASDALRRRYFTDTLPSAVLADPTPFYEAFEDGEDAMASYVTALFEMLCESEGESLQTQSFFPVIDPYVLEDTPEGFCALVMVTAEKTAAADSAAGIIVFGSAMDPRVFAAVPTMLKHGVTWGVSECRRDGLKTVAVLHRGCDNGLQLFDPPTPQKVDRDTPLDDKRRAAALIDTVVCYCMEND